MSDASVWQDEFCLVSNPPKESENRAMRVYSTVWGIDLKDLGADGFSLWLVGTLCGPERNYGFGYGDGTGIGGRFRYGDSRSDLDEPFCEVFKWMVPYWDRQHVDIAREGIAKAAAQIQNDIISHDGLIEMIEVASALGMKDIFDKFMPVLAQKNLAMPVGSPAPSAGLDLS